MNRILAITVAFPLLVSAAGCATKQETGVLTGGVLGGAVGSGVSHGRPEGIIVGSVLGALIGGTIGGAMDEQDRRYAYHALEYNRTQEPYSWRNPDNGNRYTVTPTRTYETNAGQYCREYETDAVIDGHRDRVYGNACRRPDGSWQAVN
jgi:surface antigen